MDSSTTRRDFLYKSAALAAVAFAFFPVIMYAQAGTCPDAVPRSPSSVSVSKPPYLVFLPLGTGITPAKVLQDCEYIDSLPIDGVVMKSRTVVAGNETVPYCIWSNIESVTYAEVFDEVAPLKAKFSKLNHSWLMGLTTLKAGDWFDDWSICLHNFSTVARACKDLGMEGMLFDNSNNQWNPVPIWVHKPLASNKTREQYLQQVRLRGKQIMEACVKEYPAFKLALMCGPSLSEKGDPGIVQDPSYDFLSAFYSGLVAGAGEKGMVIDASVFYDVRERKTFEGSYQFRKFDLPSSQYDSPQISKEDRALWRSRFKVGYGLCYGYTEEGMTNALLQCDYMCWYYNGADNLDPETLKQAWFPKDRFPSLGRARAAATAPGVNNVASGIHFATTFGEETIKVTLGDASFSYTLDYDNNTGSPVKITYLQKPGWIKARANNATISGVPPAKPRTHTILAMISAGGKSDTLKLIVVTSATPIHAGKRTDN